MRPLHMRRLALILSASAIALAGCGGSSKKSAPASSGGTGTSGSTNSSSILSPSTPVNSTGYRTALASRLAQIPGLPSADIPKIVNCAVQKLVSQGIKTVGDVHSHASQANQDGEACAKALGLK
jgi:hypothetical protein